MARQSLTHQAIYTGLLLTSPPPAMLYTVTWLTDFAAFLLIFSVQRELAEQAADTLLLGALGAVFSFASAISNAFGGRGSDRIGKRRMALFGTVLLLISLTTVANFSSHRPILFLAYISSGTALGTIYPSLIAWLGQGRTGKLASLAYLRFCIAWNLGMVCGQWTGGWLYGHWGINGPLRLAVPLVVISLFCLLLTREAPLVMLDTSTPSPTPTDRGRARQFSQLAWLANFGGTFSGSILFFLAPHVIVDLGIPASRHGVMLAVGRAVAVATLVLMYKFRTWHFRFSFSVAVQILGICCLIGLARTSSWLVFATMIALLSVMQGFNYFASLTYSNSGRPDSEKGAASGWNEATLALGLSGGSLFGGLAGTALGNRTPFVLAACVIGLLLALQCIRYQMIVRPRFGTSRSEPGSV